MIIKPKYLWRVTYEHDRDAQSTHYCIAPTLKDAIKCHEDKHKYEYTEIVLIKRACEAND